MNQLPITLAFLLAVTLSAPGAWPPSPAANPPADLPRGERTLEVFEHGVRPAWGYAAPQTDSLVVIHPTQPRKQAPLYVVLHSAGHDVFTCVKCTPHKGNHDIYRAPDDFYALYLDCRANKDTDWWWGGVNPRSKQVSRKNGGFDLQPVEHRVIDSVTWAIAKYDIDPNRVYLSGNSMGGSGTLGIGLRHGNLFAAIKANVPAGIEHASHRMGFPPYTAPQGAVLPDPPIVVDYSGTNDGWSVGHKRFVTAMNDRKYPLYFYWGAFGHANNDAVITQANDLVHTFDWLQIRKNAAYPVFTNASSNDPLPWPDKLTDEKPGQVNAFFRWKDVDDTPESFRITLFIPSPEALKTSFPVPASAQVDVSLRRLQQFRVVPGRVYRWSFGGKEGTLIGGADGLITLPKVTLTQEQAILSITR